MLTVTRFNRDAASAPPTLESRFGRLVNEALSNLDWGLRDSASAAWVPPVDIFEQADAIRILVEVPGVNPEHVKISVEGNVLTIGGAKEQAAEDKTERVHRYERTYGAFERTFTLPSTVDASAIRATYEHGVLTVVLPKVEKAKPRTVHVEVARR